MNRGRLAHGNQHCRGQRERENDRDAQQNQCKFFLSAQGVFPSMNSFCRYSEPNGANSCAKNKKIRRTMDATDSMREPRQPTAQLGGASGDVFSAICGMQIPRFTASKPSKFASASDEKSIRQPTTSFVRCYLTFFGVHLIEVCVKPALFEQLRACPVLDDALVGEYENLVCVANGGQAMRDWNVVRPFISVSSDC